ncbi:MAG: hypothetical protein M1402_00955 [Candidatus Thermoplasmatota archaeon]|jgi:hypothetical protein|nr:hypothetical protein [Candidatus Thermoplasmatota archaeon]
MAGQLIYSVSSTGPTGISQYYEFIIIGVIFLFIAIRVFARGINGMPYRKSYLYRRPVLYTFLTIYLIIPELYVSDSILFVLAAIPLGFILGDRFGGNVTFFNRNGTTYFKRSPVIMIIWLISFGVRLVLEVLYPTVFLYNIMVDLLLAFTDGMLIGEARNVVVKAKESKDQTLSPEANM